MRWQPIVAPAFLGLMVLICPSFSFSQVVQLPTQRQFRTTGSVSVPDRGGASSGRVHRSRANQSRQGIPFLPHQNRGLSREIGSTGSSVRVRILDQHEMDEAVLAQARWNGRQNGTTTEVQRRANFIARNISRHHRMAFIASQKVDRKSDSQEFNRLIQKGDQARAKGRVDVARIFYRTALKSASETETPIAIARLKTNHDQKNKKVAKK